MRRVISYILVTAILVLQLGGCGANTEELQGGSSSDGLKEATGPESTDKSDGLGEPANLEGALNALAISELAGKDNSLDAYSAVVNVPLRVEQPAAALEGGGSALFLGKSRAFSFKKHLFDNWEECWDELAFVTAEGEKGTARFDIENQMWGVGPVFGTDHYVVFNWVSQEDGDSYRYYLVERDENNEVLREFPLNFLNESDHYEAIMQSSFFAADNSGTVHLIRYIGTEWHYLLVSTEGEVLAEYVPESGFFRGFVPLYDGRIAIEVQDSKTFKMQLYYMDLEKGKAVPLAVPKQQVYCYTLLDENTLLYADQNGVYRSSLSGDDPELLYRWYNHGILLSDVSDIQANEEGRISLIYQGSGDDNYLCLEPTTEEVEIRQITLAVAPFNESFYKTAVALFNRQYPTCHIEVKSDYDKTALLTELIAGKGPVLVDTFLTGFEEQEKLWEPLDTVMEQLGVTEELLASAMELGKINGTLYGIVKDFRLETLLTGDPDLKDWDYDAFLQCIEDRPELEGIFNKYNGNYGIYFIMYYLSHGLEDSYLLDAEAGTTNFDSDGFRRALELANKYCVRDERVSAGSSVLEGKVLCHMLDIGRPEQLAHYRIFYGEDANYIGYPTKDGAAHFITSDSPLAIRRTATKEEKEIACAFLQLCLSYECQSKAPKNLSVRKDVLEEEIAAMNERTMPFDSDLGQIELGDDLNIEKDRKTLYDLIDKAKPERSFPSELSSVLYEELELYFDGLITEDMLIQHLESRVGLYLDERN